MSAADRTVSRSTGRRCGSATAMTQTVWHLDTSTGQPLTLPSQVGAGPSGLAMTRGVVWVANNGEQTVSRIDEPTGRVTPVGVGDGPGAVVADGSRLWVSDDYDGTVSLVDASSARLLSRYRPGSVVRGMTMVGSSLWVATQGFPGAAHTGGTFVVEGSEAATDTDRHYVDPARSDDDSLQIRSVYDGLLAYRAANERRRAHTSAGPRDSVAVPERRRPDVHLLPSARDPIFRRANRCRERYSAWCSASPDRR